MSVKILIPTPLRPYAEKKESIQFDARTVGEALDELTGRYAELRKHLYADDGRLRNFVNVYVNDEDIRFLQKEKTPLKEGDTISIIPSIAGGHAFVAPGSRAGCASDTRHREFGYDDESGK